MGTSAKCVIASLFFLNILAVCMGYVGIDKLQRYHAAPFFERDGSLHTVVYRFAPVSGRTILFWHSPAYVVTTGGETEGRLQCSRN